MKISICIPTYNRANHLANCLQSIISNRLRSEIDFEVCVSDNHSADNTEDVVRQARQKLPIKYRKNSSNIGIPKNFLNVVDMAEGEFVWLIGDDDLLMPSALVDLDCLLKGNADVDFFYVNAFHLTTQYVLSFPQPFDTSNLPTDMVPFSSRLQSGKMAFVDLIDPKISFDFLGGMFLSVFRRSNWRQNINALTSTALSDMRTFSHFDNTFPHVKIFSKAFANSLAYFNNRPLIVCLSGAREWAPMYPFVHSVRLVEALEEYKKNGLTLMKYLRCKNFALNNFIPDFIFMLLNQDRSGFVYINPWKLLFSNCLYPNFYFSFVNYFVRKLKLNISKGG